MDEYKQEGVSPRSDGIRSEVSKGFSKQSLQALGEVFDDGRGVKRIRTGAINFANDQISNQQRVARESPLLQFDIKMDSLRIFLQNMTITIGDHAKVLHDHQTQFRRRCIDPQLGEVLRYIAKFTPKDAILREASRIHCEHRFIESLKDQIFQGKSEKDFKELKAGADQLAQKIKLMGDAIAFLLSIRGDSEAAMKALMDALAGKADLAYVKDKLKRRKIKFHAKIEAGDDDLQQQINILKQSMTAHHNDMSDKVSECEERTLDKINDCNLVFKEFMATMLRRKASEEFVNKRVDNLEERILREVDNRSDRLTERVEKALEEMRKLFKERDQASGNKLSGIKNQLADLESKLAKKSDKGDLDKFILDQRLADEKINNEIGDLNTFLKKHDEEFKRVFKLLKKIQDEHAAFQKKLSAAVIPSAPAGIPKDELDTLLSSQSKNLLNKLDQMSSRIEGLYTRVAQLEGGKVDRDQIAHLKGGADLANLKNALQAKIAQMVPHAELAQLRKMVKQKANAEKTGNELTNLNDRMAGYEALLKQINDEMEAFAKALAEAQDTMKNIQFMKPDVIAGTRNINCLVCGRSDRGEIILGKPKREKYVVQRRNSQIVGAADEDELYRHVTPHTARGEARKVVLPNIKKKLAQARHESATVPDDVASSYDAQHFHMTPKQTKLGSRRESVSPSRTYGGDDGRARSNERGGGRMSAFDSMKVQSGADLTSVKAMIRPKPY